MTFKLRNEHNSHTCVWCTPTHACTHAQTHACVKSKICIKIYICWQNNVINLGVTSEAEVWSWSEIFRVLWGTVTGTRQLMVAVLNQTNPFHVPTRHSFSIQLHILFPATSILFKHVHQNSICILFVPPLQYAPIITLTSFSRSRHKYQDSSEKKITQEQAKKAQTGSRGRALLFL